MFRLGLRRGFEFVALVALVAAPAAVLAAATSAGAATTTTVTNTSDDGSLTSLRGVLSDVSDGDTVVLTAGATYQLTRCEGTLALGTGQITIAGAVTVQGNGATIEQTCEGERVLFTMHDITLDNVTITGGDTPNEGGGLFNANGATTLTGVTFTGNTACAGGGVYAVGPLTVSGSTFTDNSIAFGHGCALTEGGAIEFDPEGVHLDAVTPSSAVATIADSTFSSNTSENHAGAIGAASGASMLVTGSTFDGNSASEHAGAILSDAAGFDLTVVNSTFVANESCVWGAIAALDGANLNLVYDTMTDNAIHACAGSVGPSDIDVRPTAVTALSGSFASFATVITGPSDSPYCEVSGASGGSLGYNYSNEASDSCSFSASTDSVQSTNDPSLGGLAGNGGPTMTELPQTGSPLIDAIPTSSCSDGDAAAGSGVVTDQRGFERPDAVSGTCDIGAVEVQTVVPPTPEPTPTPAPAVITAPKFTG